MVYTFKEKEANNKAVSLSFDSLTRAYKVQVLENVGGLWYGRKSMLYPTKDKATKAYYRYCRTI